MKQFIFAFLLFTWADSIAQTLQVGPALSSRLAIPVFDDPILQVTNKGQWSPGFSAGVTTTLKASEFFGLTTEVLFHHQTKHIRSTDQFSYFRERLNYIKIPALLQFTRQINYYQTYALVGPVVNYWIGGYGKALVPELVEGDLENGTNYTIKYTGLMAIDRFYVSDPNRWQLGIQLGGGVAIPIQRNYLKVDARFEWGHTNLAKDNSSYSPFVFYDISLAHTFHSFSLSCAYVFSFDLFEMSRKGKSTNKNK